MSGRTPYAPSMRVSARSVASTAGWVISVCISCLASRSAAASVGGVGEDVLGQRLAQQRRHDPVGLVERRGDQRLALTQLGEHVDVLRALAGVEERDLCAGRRGRRTRPGRAASSTWPGCRRRSACTALPALVGQLGGVGVVDRHPHRRARQRGVRRARGRYPPGRRVGGQPLQLRGHVGVVGAADHGRPAQRRLPGGRRRQPRSPAPAGPSPPGMTGSRRSRGAGRARTPRARRGSWCRRTRTR